ncbi:MAG TPA: glycogen-binding domain-containing protein [Kofleriaceae bacterium]|jgi:hypothetical protein
MRLWLVAALALAACRPPGYGSGQGATPDAAGSGMTIDAPPATDAATDAGSGCAYQFQLYGYGASSSVWVTGDFVQWATNPPGGAVAMVLGSDAAWAVTYTFTPGTYQYKFIIDGTTFIADPDDANVVDDGFGGYNSVYVCM